MLPSILHQEMASGNTSLQRFKGSAAALRVNLMRMCTECHLWLKEPRRKIKISNKDISNEDIDREKSKKGAGVVNIRCICCAAQLQLAWHIQSFNLSPTATASEQQKHRRRPRVEAKNQSAKRLNCCSSNPLPPRPLHLSITYLQNDKLN